MDEAREEREELAALDAEVEDLRREQEAEERFWTDDAAKMLRLEAWLERRLP